jgi:hypothetical protein
VPVELLGVRVEVAKLGVVDRRRHPGADQPGNQPQPLGESGLGIFADAALGTQHLLKPGARGVRDHGAARHELK